MHTFNDTKGRTWEINLTIGAVKRVKQALDVDLLDPLSELSQPDTGDKPDLSVDLLAQTSLERMPLLTRLQADVVLLIDVIFVLVQPQAKELDVSDEQFGEALGGDAAYAAYDSFMCEWQAFFLQLRRETAAKAISRSMAMVAAEDKKSVAMVEQATEAVEILMENQRAKATKKIKNLGALPTVTNFVEPSDSTPGPLTP